MELSLEGGAPTCCYGVAGRSLWVDRPMAELSPFRVPLSFSPAASSPAAKSGSSLADQHLGAPPPHFAGRVWVAGAEREVVAGFGSSGYRIRVEGVGAFDVARDGRRIELAESAELCEQTENAAALGPALTIALAAEGVFTLHASAVLAGGGAVLFLGESGAGKSTVAAYLTSERPILLLADDVVPTEGHFALPRFPQLKLSADDQPGPRSADRVPLKAIYLLDPDPAASSLQSVPLTPAEAVIALARHTVASKLFCRELLSAHLAYASRLAEAIGVTRLRYPKIWASLPPLRDLILHAGSDSRDDRKRRGTTLASPEVTTRLRPRGVRS